MKPPLISLFLAGTPPPWLGFSKKGPTIRTLARTPNALAKGLFVPGLTGALLCILAGAFAFGQVGGPPPVPQESLPHLTPDEIRLYEQARTVMDWSPEKIRSRPELKNLQPAEDQRDLPMILRKVGERVAILFETLPDTMSTEKVLIGGQEDFPHDHGAGFGENYFRYLVLVHSRQGMPVLEEYRTNQVNTTRGLIDLPRNPHKNAVDVVASPYGPLHVPRLLATALNFHPRMQATCRFRYLGRQMLNERESEVVGFAQIPEGNPDVSTFRNASKTVGLLVQGLAWFDATSYDVLRIQTDLLAPRPDVGLKKLTIEIEFQSTRVEGVQLVRRGETPATFQLPTKAVVHAKLAGQESRTIHHYSDFKLFRAESRIIPTTESGLALGPGGNSAPIPVKPQPLTRDDIWFQFLMSDYNHANIAAQEKTKGMGGAAERDLNYYQKMLGLTQNQIAPIHAAALRLQEELTEIYARKKALTEAERAAHPEPPELNALNQKYEALLEREVSHLKGILGRRSADTLDEYVQTRFARQAAFSPLPGFAGTQNPHIETLRMYDLFLERAVDYDRAMADYKELGSIGGVNWSKISPSRNLALTKGQFEHVRVAGMRLAAARKERLDEWRPIFAAYSATTFTSPELKALDQQREATIATEVSNLRRTLGPDLTARIDAALQKYPIL